MASTNPIIQSEQNTYLTRDIGSHKRRDFHECWRTAYISQKNMDRWGFFFFFSEINKLKVEDDDSMTGWILHKEYENSGEIK